MPTRINRAPGGLLSLLSTKAFGENPSELDQLVRPTLDLTDLLLGNVGLNVDIAVNNGVAAVGVTASIGPPAGKIWIVKCVDVALTTNVGLTQIYAFPVVSGFLGSSTAPLNLLSAIPFTNTAAAGVGLWDYSSGWLDQGIVLQAPATAATRIAQIVGGTVDVTTKVAYYELDI